MNFIKYSKLYFLFSGLLILAGSIALYLWRLNLGVDFTGGTVVEYRFKQTISTEVLTNDFQGANLEVAAIQEVGENSYLFRLKPITIEQKAKINEVLTLAVGGGNFEEIRFETVGPSIGPELVRKTIYAIVIAALGILFWVAFQFKSIKFGGAAILATLHDSFLLIGAFSIFGHFFGAEIDFLFVTALLTTISFSVHDTIVVFDRIRELRRLKGITSALGDVVNEALTETMVRSLNNSFTIIFMLVAIILLGGTTLQWFAVALLVGTIFGTYSSPFIAAPLLVFWESLSKRHRV